MRRAVAVSARAADLARVDARPMADAARRRRRLRRSHARAHDSGVDGDAAPDAPADQDRRQVAGPSYQVVAALVRLEKTRRHVRLRQPRRHQEHRIRDPSLHGDVSQGFYRSPHILSLQTSSARGRSARRPHHSSAPTRLQHRGLMLSRGQHRERLPLGFSRGCPMLPRGSTRSCACKQRVVRRAS